MTLVAGVQKLNHIVNFLNCLSLAIISQKAYVNLADDSLGETTDLLFSEVDFFLQFILVIDGVHGFSFADI
jgi:hypothetical protein